MSIAEENTAILRRAFDIWNETKGGSTDHWLEIIADELDFRSLAEGSGNLAFTERRKSKQDFVGYLEGLTTTFEMIHYTVEKYIAQDDHVVAIGSTSWRNKETGAVFDTPKADVVQFKDGKIIAFFELYDTAQVQACAATA